LASRDWLYYGDDVVGLGADGFVLPLPTAVSLKEGSWPLFHATHPQLEQLPVIRYGSKTARFLPISVESFGQPSQRRLAAWVFPEFRADAVTRFEAIDTEYALQALITGGLALADPVDAQGVHALLTLLTNLPKYRLVYASLAEAQTCLQSLLTR
jgi:hypothetical protein